MPSSSGKSNGKVAGALLLVSLIAYEIAGYPAISLGSSRERVDYEPGLRAVIDELERQGLVGRISTRAFGSGNVMIRKSVSPSDFRLRFGKRNSVGPAAGPSPHGGPTLETAQQLQQPARGVMWQGTSSSQRND